MHFDMPLEELKTYAPVDTEPEDFDAFWQQTLTQTRQHALNATFEPVDYGLQTIETFDVTFNGSNLSSGVYYYRLTAGEMTTTKKLMLTK